MEKDNRIFDLVKFLWHNSDDYDSCMKFISDNDYTEDDIVDAIVVLNTAMNEFEQDVREEVLEEICQKNY